MFLPLHDRNPIRHVAFPYVNYTLIGVTIVCFLMQALLPQAAFDQVAIDFGLIPIVVRGLYPEPLPWLPGWVTLFTYAFLHANWWHVLGNMLMLWVFGDNIEDALGHAKYLLFYLGCAACAGLAHLAFNLNDTDVLVGASGAVAGVMGAYILLYPHARILVLARIVIPIPLPMPAFWMLGLWIIIQIANVLMGSMEPVSWWAHLGGFATGMVLAAIGKRPQVALLGGR
jgi:membrane associated rhomboid family serine protease